MGKTTVKEMLAAIMREALDAGPLAPLSPTPDPESSVLATRGNLNNDIGVPLTLLELRAGHRCAVIEMGMNHAGEIGYLGRLARPDVALVTNAGPVHIEFFDSEAAIARAKGEILEELPAAAPPSSTPTTAMPRCGGTSLPAGASSSSASSGKHRSRRATPCACSKAK